MLKKNQQKIWNQWSISFILKSFYQIPLTWSKFTAMYGILLPKLFWLTVRNNCSSDREKLLKFKAEGLEFAKTFEITRTICWNSERSEQFLVTEWFLTCSWRFFRSNHEFCNIIQNGCTEYVLSFPLNEIKSIHVCFPCFAPPFAAFNSSIIDPMEFILIQVSTASAHCKVLPHSVSIFS